MKLVVAIIQREVADDIIDALMAAEFRATRLAGTGGFLRRGNLTLLTGVQDEQADRVIEIIRKTARDLGRPAVGPDQEATATIFILDLDEQIRV